MGSVRDLMVCVRGLIANVRGKLEFWPKRPLINVNNFTSKLTMMNC